MRTSHFGCRHWGGCNHCVDSLRTSRQGKSVTSCVHRIRMKRKAWTDITTLSSSALELRDESDMYKLNQRLQRYIWKYLIVVYGKRVAAPSCECLGPAVAKSSNRGDVGQGPVSAGLQNYINSTLHYHVPIESHKVVMNDSVHLDTITARHQLRPTSRKNLRPRLQRLQILSRAQLPVGLQIPIKRHQITTVRCDRAIFRDEAVHNHVSIVALDEVERRPADRGGRDGGRRIAVVAERTDPAVHAEPDHHFVRLAAAGTRAEEGVVGHVGSEGRARVAVYHSISCSS